MHASDWRRLYSEGSEAWEVVLLGYLKERAARPEVSWVCGCCAMDGAALHRLRSSMLSGTLLEYPRFASSDLIFVYNSRLYSFKERQAAFSFE